MTTYVAIAESEVGSNKPITTSLMLRLVRNILAIVEGDSSAPLVLFPVPRNKAVFTALATDQTWTNTTGKTVRLYVMLKGAGGGASGPGPGAHASGGPGTVLLMSFLVPNGDTITLRVGGGGVHGTYTTSFGKNGGGGGGSGTRLVYGALTAVAGGGGGGGGNSGDVTCYGGAGGVAGQPVGAQGGAAGIGGVTANGGAAGTADGTVGTTGTVSQTTEGFDYLFAADGVTPAAGGVYAGTYTGSLGLGQDGLAVLRW